MEADRLANVPPFNSLPDDARLKFAIWVGELKVPEGKHLVDQGDYSYELFAIEEGTAEVLRDGARVAELGPGDFFGEMGVLERAQRNATVISTSPMKMLTLSHWDVSRLKKQSPDAIEQLQKAVEQRRPSE